MTIQTWQVLWHCCSKYALIIITVVYRDGDLINMLWLLTKKPHLYPLDKDFAKQPLGKLSIMAERQRIPSGTCFQVLIFICGDSRLKNYLSNFFSVPFLHPGRKGNTWLLSCPIHNTQGRCWFSSLCDYLHDSYRITKWLKFKESSENHLVQSSCFRRFV